MRKERERRTLETAGMLFTLLFGNLLHFVYDWTGQAGWAAYLSAVNESTWEHMKLLAVPWLVWTVVTIVVNRCAASALPRAIGLLAGLAAIPALFYTYTGILGKSVGVVNILIFQAARAAGIFCQCLPAKERPPLVRSFPDIGHSAPPARRPRLPFFHVLSPVPSPVCGPHKWHPRHTAKNAVIPTVCS